MARLVGKYYAYGTDKGSRIPVVGRSLLGTCRTPGPASITSINARLTDRMRCGDRWCHYEPWQISQLLLVDVRKPSQRVPSSQIKSTRVQTGVPKVRATLSQVMQSHNNFEVWNNDGTLTSSDQSRLDHANGAKLPSWAQKDGRFGSANVFDGLPFDQALWVPGIYSMPISPAPRTGGKPILGGGGGGGGRRRAN
jgi:hypothetical protein